MNPSPRWVTATDVVAGRANGSARLAVAKSTTMRRAVPQQRLHRRDQGQLTVLMALVMTGLLVVALAFGTLGQSMVDRWAAVDAANAVALASAGQHDPGALIATYEDLGLDVTIVATGHATAQRGLASAESWAETESAALPVSPVVVAMLARAEQMVGWVIEPVRLIETRIELSATDAIALAPLLTEFGWCLVGPAAFDRC